MDLADRCQMDDERAELQARKLALRQPVQPVEHTHVRVRRECEDCGVVMSQRRLQAMPTATRCVECQEDFERSYRK